VRWLVGLALIVLAARPASACGFFHMTDVEKHLDIEYVIDAASIRALGKDDKPATRVGVYYLDIEAKAGLRVVADHKVVFDIAGGKLVHFGKPVATIDGDTITFGKTAYTIELSDEHAAYPDSDKIRAWKVVVKRGDTVVLQAADASALCAALDGKRDAKDEVRRRVIYYLAWRET
jgi:hypothetical protein